VVSPDFNSRIHRELARESRVNRRYWQILRPGLCAMGGSFAVTITLLGLFSGSAHSTFVRDIPKLNMTTAQRAGRMEDVESLIERTDLTSASIRTLLLPDSAPARASSPDSSTAPSIKPSPHTRRVQGA
jgi:hypothetical protein